MSRKPISVRYRIEGEKIKTILLDVGATVGDFLEQVRKSETNTDICAVYIKGRQLDVDDLIQNHIKSKDDTLIVSDDPEKTAEDFIDDDNQSQPSKIDEWTISINSSRRKASLLPKSKFEKKNVFKVYTTANPNSLLEGNDVTILDTDTFESISDKINNLIKNFENDEIPEDFEVHIFLPGGVPFLSGQIKPYFNSTEITHNRLYVVVTKQLGDKINEKVKEPCNCSKKFADALSPLFESSEAGLTQIACLLGYIFHYGLYAEHLLQILAKTTRFAPLITNYYRLLENAPLTFLNIVSITGPLFTFFKSLIPHVPSENIFEYTLKIFSFIGLLSDVEYLPIHTIDCEDETDDNNAKLREYLKETEQQSHIVIWEADTSHPDYKGFNLIDQEFDKIDKIFEADSTFKPIPPLSLHYIYYPSFIMTSVENSVMLFLQEAPGKKKHIKYIDPHVGKVQLEDIEELAKNLKINEKENVMDLIDHSRVQQINCICFDQSISMKFKLTGGNPKPNERSRAQLATDFLHALIEQSYKFRVSSIYGLISFDSKINTLQDLTPMSSDFINKLSEIKPSSNTLLWDAINEAKKQILDLVESQTTDEDEPPFPNAKYRIIVITDGDDNKSKTKLADLANDLIENSIIVDTILVSHTDLNNTCCALSKLTGGLCFRPESKESGLKIFEQEAFLNLSSRHLTGPKYGKEKLSEEEINELASKFDKFDTFAENQEILNAKVDFPLSTPLFMCYQYHTKDPETIIKKRAVLELNIIGHHPSETYKVFSSHANPTEWRIFIKGPKGTPFENKWLNIFMILPNEYPFNPPKFRFMTVPFHPNVSSEGVVLFSLIDKDYSSDANIGDLINGIIELLATPEKDLAINMEAMNLYLEDNEEYINRQKSEEVGIDDYNDFIKSKVFDEIPEDVEIPEDTRDNLYMTNACRSFRGKVLISDDEEDQYDLSE